jgi:outer membrane protein assembly factor BamB
MSDESAKNRGATVVAGESPPRRSHRLWFPVVVVLTIAAWWVWQAGRHDYHTLGHAIAILVGVQLISAWFGSYGYGPPRWRWSVVGLLWLSFALFFAIVRPVYNGDMGVINVRFRYAPAADQRLDTLAVHGSAVDWQATPRDYPRFLGGGYWAEVANFQLATDWAAHPPQEVWRREIGAGWSAFAIVGPYAVTQEQRGESELVSCYQVADGSPVWTHADAARFDPGGAGGLGGTGPRATPTIIGERIVTQGSTGIVNCLDARTGKVIWSHDTIAETGADLPLWAKSGSPLLVDDVVVISVGAPIDVASAEGTSEYHSSLVAYDLATGEVRWSAGSRRASYASPILATFDGVRQIVVINEGYVTGHDAASGEVLWEYIWPSTSDTTPTCSQPVPLPGDRLFLSKGYGIGASLVQIGRDAAGDWQIRPLWSPAIKPVMKTKFSNVVVRGEFMYGLDDVLLSCIEWETGSVEWKKRRSPPFGHGQLLLAGDKLLVLSESGELAMVDASPDPYRERGRIQVLTAGSVTWNNPAFAAPFLLVRNAQEAACYRLPLAQ